MGESWRVVTHGGAGSDPARSGTTRKAAQIALDALDEGTEPIEAACQSVAFMEQDGGFNAGVGSNLRRDGSTVQMDAACADAAGRFGAVACIERVVHPIHVARDVLGTEHILLAGDGALSFARERGRGEIEPEIRRQTREERHASGSGSSSSDTVGCVLGDGERFAGALSSGGTRDAMVGRVGDVALPGCGLRAGPGGAVAATGHGESIAMNRIADRVYREMVSGGDLQQIVEERLSGFENAALGLIVVSDEDSFGGSNRSMAYSQLRG